MQRNTITARGGFFPDAVDQQLKQYNLFRGKTIGMTTVHRLITGDLTAVSNIIDQALAEYDLTRMKHPEITNFRLYQDMPALVDTGTELMDYSGSVQSITRESVMIAFDNGQFRSMDRNVAIGFRGIIRKARAPWSQGSWVNEQFWRRIGQSLVTGTPLGRIDPAYARSALKALLRMKRQERNFAWSELRKAYTDERFNKAVAADEAVRELQEAVSIAKTMAATPMTTIPLPLPDRSSVMELWKQGYLPTLNYEAYAPYGEGFAAPARKVTFVRGAVLTNNKMVITLNTNPRACAVRSPDTVISYVTYGPPDDGTVNITVGAPPRPSANPQSYRPPQVVLSGWDGTANRQDPWSVVMAPGKSSELDGTLHTCVRRITEGQANLLAAFALDRPVLMAGSVHGMGFKAVPLVLPEMMLNVDVIPLVGETHELLPLDVGATVTGQALTKAAGMTIQSGPYQGFTTKPSAGRPQRTGVISELFG